MAGVPPLPGQTIPTVDYRSDVLPAQEKAPCVQGATFGPDGELIAACDYNPSVHRNTDKLASCQARVRAAPPAECQSQVFTASGVEDIVREALRAQAAELRESMLVQCRASAIHPEECDKLRP